MEVVSKRGKSSRLDSQALIFNAIGWILILLMAIQRAFTELPHHLGAGLRMALGVLALSRALSSGATGAGGRTKSIWVASTVAESSFGEGDWFLHQ